MEYVLTLLGNGRSLYRERALRAFYEFVTPQPSAVFEWDDSGTRLGQCAAHGKCWEAAASSEFQWCFHLEEDMRILRPIDLLDLQGPMLAYEDSGWPILQMALMRTPWGSEIEHGGYVAQNPGFYVRRRCWFEQTRNWTNAPALYRTDLCREFPWSPEPGCETEIGPRILAAYPDAVFGIWGSGEMQVAHIGAERAPGSHGY